MTEQWRTLALLPHLTEPELEQLHIAVQIRIQHLRSILEVSRANKIREDATEALRINESLATAIAEARQSIARQVSHGDD